ncbi:MAG TPA: DUF3703 domain-containing protein [Cyclobacteriaceae bacterium]|nr:DUF3703 domain-containing protein [Cyclobacteriaceae bacterium]
MKVYWSMPAGVKIFFRQELRKFRIESGRGNLTMAWYYLERAHILGQTWPREHSLVHWLMLKFGFRMKSRKEILGQLPRLLLGGVKSFVGKIPRGNTGGANVPGLRPMEIPDDLQEILEPYLAGELYGKGNSGKTVI